MKRLLPILTLVVLAGIAAHGQDFKKFKVGIGVGYGLPSEGDGGVLIYLEPMYRIKDNITVGLRIETFLFPGAPISGTPYSITASGVGSYTLNGQYYFGNGLFRPFVGAGFGMYTLASAALDNSATGVSLNADASVIGFYPRIGFDFGHFNLSVDYNVIPAQENSFDIAGIITVDTQNSSYIGVRIGASIGGGKN